MSSVQQITIGLVLLGTAFVLGHYISKQPAPNSATADSQSATAGDDVVWQKKPAEIPTLKDRQQTGSFLDLDKQTSETEPKLAPALKSQSTNLAQKQPAQAPNLVKKGPTTTVAPDFSALMNGLIASGSTPRAPASSSDRIPYQEPSNKEPSKTDLLTPNRQLAGRSPAEKPSFSDDDFQPQLKERFEKRIESLRRANLTPAPDDDPPADSRWTLNNNPFNRNPVDQDGGTPPRLADQIPLVESPPSVVDQAKPRRDDVTRSDALETRETSQRLVPFRSNVQPRSQLVNVRSEQSLKIETQRYSEHLTVRGDTLQSISRKYYGKPDFYLDIFVANQARLRTPASVPSGIRLKIPLYD